MNDIKTDTRPRFFPKTRSHIKSKNNASMKLSSLARNSEDRKQFLDDIAKKNTHVEIPTTVKDFSRIRKAVDYAPEVDNSNKIMRLKKQIQEGSYKIDYDALADKILSSDFSPDI